MHNSLKDLACIKLHRLVVAFDTTVFGLMNLYWWYGHLKYSLFCCCTSNKLGPNIAQFFEFVLPIMRYPRLRATNENVEYLVIPYFRLLHVSVGRSDLFVLKTQGQTSTFSAIQSAPILSSLLECRFSRKLHVRYTDMKRNTLNQLFCISFKLKTNIVFVIY